MAQDSTDGKKVTAKDSKSTNMITCKANGSRCNICGGMIPDADFVCANGHEIGQKYHVPKTAAA